MTPKAILRVASLLAIGTTATAAGGAPPVPVEPHFLPMAPIIVPIVGSDRFDGALHVKLVLVAEDAASLDGLTERLPTLRAVSLAGAIEFSRLFASPQAPVDARRLSIALTAALRTADARISRVLIVEVSAQS